MQPQSRPDIPSLPVKAQAHHLVKSANLSAPMVFVKHATSSGLAWPIKGKWYVMTLRDHDGVKKEQAGIFPSLCMHQARVCIWSIGSKIDESACLILLGFHELRYVEPTIRTHPSPQPGPFWKGSTQKRETWIPASTPPCPSTNRCYWKRPHIPTISPSERDWPMIFLQGGAPPSYKWLQSQ